MDENTPALARRLRVFVKWENLIHFRGSVLHKLQAQCKCLHKLQGYGYRVTVALQNVVI